MILSTQLIGIIAGVIVLFVLYGMYVGLIKKRNKVKEAFASVDVQLKKRYDLIPNILAIAQKYMEHERGIMEEVTKLRTQYTKLPDNFENIAKKIELDNQITSKMGELKIAVENYPQLKADNTMVTAMQSYNEVEEHIAAARRFYNTAVNELKNAVEIFPSSLVAAICGIKAADFFEISDTERQPVSAKDFFNGK